MLCCYLARTSPREIPAPESPAASVSAAPPHSTPFALLLSSQRQSLCAGAGPLVDSELARPVRATPRSSLGTASTCQLRTCGRDLVGWLLRERRISSVQCRNADEDADGGHKINYERAAVIQRGRVIQSTATAGGRQEGKHAAAAGECPLSQPRQIKKGSVGKGQ